MNTFAEFLQRIMEAGLEAIGLYYSEYRAKVINVSDPDNLGRIIVHCEQVHGDTYPEVWAWPETPYAGNGYGLWAIPDVGEWVYVHFDHGRPDKPIWHGGWWADDEITDEDMIPSKVVLRVKEGMKVVLDRDNQTILLEQSLGNSVFISDEGMDLQHVGTITVNGQDVTVQSMGSTEVRSQGPCTVEGLDDVSITSAGAVRIDGADAVDIGSTAAVRVHSAAMVDVNSDTVIALTSPKVINLTAPTITVTGSFSLTGNFAMVGDGQVVGKWYATLSDAHHEHPVSIPTATALPGLP